LTGLKATVRKDVSGDDAREGEIQMTQNQLEAKLLGDDIRQLTETINWMVGQHLEPRLIKEAQDKRAT
jgi:hypothetical protein